MIVLSSAMPLTKHQRRDLVRADQSYDVVAIATAITTVMRENETAMLLDCEMALRDAAGAAYLVAMPGSASGFEVVLGFRSVLMRLAVLDRTFEQNRDMLARAIEFATLIG